MIDILEKALAIVAEVTNEKPDDIKSKNRSRELVRARQFFVQLVYSDKSTKKSLQKIATFLGDRDHSTIINNRKSFDDFYEIEKDYKEMYDKIHKIYTDEYGMRELYYWAEKTKIEYHKDNILIEAYVYKHDESLPFLIFAKKPLSYQIRRAIPIADPDWKRA